MKLSIFSKPKLFSPKDLVQRAVFITTIYLLLHGAGLREFASVLNGTMGSIQLGWKISALLGVTYIFTYLCFVVGVPILLFAAALLTLWSNVSEKRSQSLVSEHKE